MSMFHPLRSALCSLAACALALAASAQHKPAPHCPSAQSLKAEQLHGHWAVHFANPPAGLPRHATLRLQRHAEFADSLAGSINRKMPKIAAPAPGHAARAALAGDLDEGMLQLDESSDEVNVTATWSAEMVAGSCGKVFRGSWTDTSPGAAPDAPEVAFTLTRLP